MHLIASDGRCRRNDAAKTVVSTVVVHVTIAPEACQNLVFVTKAGDPNYANCNGTYVLDPRFLNGQPIYINAAKDRFIGFESPGWEITATGYLDGILAAGGSFGGYHNNVGDDVYSTWDSYTVHKPPGC